MKFILYAHRGASYRFPDNSNEAFQLAIEEHSDVIETDVRKTKDGVLVLFHDPAVSGIPTESLLYMELKQQIPHIVTFSDTVLHFGNKIPFCWEIKTPGIEKEVVEFVSASVSPSIFDRTQFTSFSKESTRVFKEYSPSCFVGLLTNEWSQTSIDEVVHLRVNQICPPAENIIHEPHLVLYAHTAGLNIRAWNVSNPEVVQTLASLGVDGCTVNWPRDARKQLGFII